MELFTLGSEKKPKSAVYLLLNGGDGDYPSE